MRNRRRFVINPSRQFNPVAPLNVGKIMWLLNLPNAKKGGIWQDVCGNNHGVQNGTPVWTGARGRPGGYSGFSVNAAPYWTCGTPTLGLQAATVSCWLNSNNVNFSDDYIFDSVDDSTNGDGMQLRFDGGAGNAKLEFKRTYGYSGSYAVANAGAVAGQWYHAVATVDSAATTILYINGVKQTTTGTGTSTALRSTTTYICRRTAGSIFFNGYLDDVGLWKRCLSAAEVEALYIASMGGYKKELATIGKRVVIGSAAAPAATTVFRKTLSGVGTGVGKRQIHGWG